MNRNLFSNGIMRRMRQFTHDMTANAHSKDKDIERLLSLKKSDEITQTVYDREYSAIQDKIQAQTVKLQTACKKDLDQLEGYLAYFLTNFNGDTVYAPATVLRMLPYFQPDEQYMESPNRPLDTDKVNKFFWSEFVQLSSSDAFDDPDHVNGAPKAMYFFGDVKALSAFIQKMTVGVEGSLVEDITNEILSNCPEQYGAIYRNYKATGEMLDLNEPMTE